MCQISWVFWDRLGIYHDHGGTEWWWIIQKSFEVKKIAQNYIAPQLINQSQSGIWTCMRDRKNWLDTRHMSILVIQQEEVQNWSSQGRMTVQPRHGIWDRNLIVQILFRNIRLHRSVLIIQLNRYSWEGWIIKWKSMI